MRQHKVFWQVKEVKLQIINAWIEIKIDSFLQYKILSKYLKAILCPFTNYTKIRTLIRLNYVTWTLGAKII